MNIPFRKSFLTTLVSSLVLPWCASAQEINTGATEKTPSRSEYFSWINNTNEGADEHQTMVNLDFFRWLHDEYGMKLDIYALDAGAIDGKRFYGTMSSGRFRSQFPHGFGPIAEKAGQMGTRMGIWGGPDGFGDTPELAARRKEEMVSLCRDFNWALFKFDLVCGPLPKEHEDDFISMMKECRKYCPDLILLNHRLNLEEARKYATTFLWEGVETYIDVHMTAQDAVPYNRAVALERGTVPGLQRLTEDHGVCLSSYLDYWQDDLILQAFNRCLLLAPQIYGNPWFLRDDEYPQLARIFNLHDKYAGIMVEGMELPESYGPHAVARGDGKTRLLTLRNLEWEPVTYTLSLDEEIGLAGTDGKVEVRQFHPSEKVIGRYSYGRKVNVTVPPFRACLLAISAEEIDEPYVEGCDYQVVRNVPGRPLEIDLLGLPGTQARITYPSGLKGHKPARVTFPGKRLALPYQRKIADLDACAVPEDADALYEAAVFAADNNALEVRSLERSGGTSIPEVAAARKCFLGQDSFKYRGVWDKALFDGDMKTAFWPSKCGGNDYRIDRGCFRLDLGKETWVEKIIIKVKDINNLQPLYEQEANSAYISTDLESWKEIMYLADIDCEIPVKAGMRYLKLRDYPSAIYEVEVWGKEGQLDPSGFRASNLFSPGKTCKAAWSTAFTLPELARGSYLCVAVKGNHGQEGAYAAVKVGDRYAERMSRSSAFPSNTFEYRSLNKDANYTYYIPLDESAVGEKIEVSVMAYDEDHINLDPEVWIWTDEIPYEKVRLTF